MWQPIPSECSNDARLGVNAANTRVRKFSEKQIPDSINRYVARIDFSFGRKTSVPTEVLFSRARNRRHDPRTPVNPADPPAGREEHVPLLIQSQ